MFNKTILLNNISFLLKKKSMKIGELENAIGVSKGYISRMNKKSQGVATGIDIIYEIARVLDVSVDALISVDYQKINDNEAYLLKLFSVFNLKTENRELVWKKTDSEKIYNMLSGIAPNIYPMLETYPGDKNEHDLDMVINDYNYISRKIYVSPFLGKQACLDNQGLKIGPWFWVEMDEQNTIYFTNIFAEIDPEEKKKAYEIYIESTYKREGIDENGQIQPYTVSKTIPLCCSEKVDLSVADAMNSLYQTIIRHQNDVYIPTELKKAFDNFMM